MSENNAYKQGYEDGYTDAIKIYEAAVTGFAASVADELPKEIKKLLEGER